MKFDPETILLELKGGRLHIMFALAMLPTLSASEGSYAGKKCLSMQEISHLSGLSSRTVQDEMKFLKRRGYAYKLHRYGWRLSEGATQEVLPLLWQGNNGKYLADSTALERQITAVAVDNSHSSTESYTQATSGAAKFAAHANVERKNLPLDHMIDLSEEEEDINMYGNKPFTESAMLLQEINVPADFADIFGRYPLEKTLAAWWYIKVWANNPAALYHKHMTTKRTTPKSYDKLVAWWLSADSEQREEVCLELGTGGNYFPQSWNQAMVKEAKKVFGSESGFDWPL